MVLVADSPPLQNQAHNISGIVHLMPRGTDGSSFKCDVAGNDKNYGFNIWNDRSGSLYVFEAAIDLMSFASLYGDYESNKLALGMLHDAPLALPVQAV